MNALFQKDFTQPLAVALRDAPRGPMNSCVDRLKPKVPRYCGRTSKQADDISMGGGWRVHKITIDQYGICRKGNMPLDSFFLVCQNITHAKTP